MNREADSADSSSEVQTAHSSVNIEKNARRAIKTVLATVRDVVKQRLIGQSASVRAPSISAKWSVCF
jgi:hypothetical protein